jgi:DNA segregation ATPase FtsK/SpoIIIE-like protein
MQNSETLEKEVITLDLIQVRNLPELQGWKEKQQAIVKANPFVSCEDPKTYEKGKNNRTALVSARTDIQKQDKLIASKLKEIRSEAAKISEELIAITQPHEDKQQEEVRRYEAAKEMERLEKERIEKERKQALQMSINDFYVDWKHEISKAEFGDLKSLDVAIAEALNIQSKIEMEEFESDHADNCTLLRIQLQEKIQYLTEKENTRLEAEKLAAERAAFEKEQAARKKVEKRERAAFAKEQADAREKAEKEDLLKKQVEAKERAARESEIKELALQRLEIEEEKKRLADIEDARLAVIVKEKQEKAAIEAEVKRIEAEKVEKAKLAKRLKALQPDKEKAEAVIKSLTIDYSPEVVIKDASIDSLLIDYIGEADFLTKTFLTKLSAIK